MSSILDEWRIRHVSGGHCHAASTAALGTHVLRHAISTGHRQCGKLLSELDLFLLH